LKILIIPTREYLGSQVGFGGGEMQVIKTSQALAKLGHQVTLDTSLRYLPSDEVKEFDVIHIFSVWFGVELQDTILRRIKEIKSQDQIIALSPIQINDSVSETWSNSIKQIFASPEHHDKIDSLPQMYVNNTRINYIHADKGLFGFESCVDLILPNSSLEGFLIRRQLQTDVPICRIVNAVDASDYPTRLFDIKEKEIVLIGAARIEPIKNQLLACHALREADFPVYVIGQVMDSVYLDLCKQAAGPNTTIIERRLERPEFIELLGRARVHLLPSWYETTGIASLEAALLSASLVLGSHGAEQKYFGAYARYVEPASTQQILRSVKESWDMWEDEFEEREKLSGIIRSIYTWDKAARQTQDAYSLAFRRQRLRKRV